MVSFHSEENLPTIYITYSTSLSYDEDSTKLKALKFYSKTRPKIFEWRMEGENEGSPFGFFVRQKVKISLYTLRVSNWAVIFCIVLVEVYLQAEKLVVFNWLMVLKGAKELLDVAVAVVGRSTYCTIFLLHGGLH